VDHHLDEPREDGDGLAGDLDRLSAAGVDRRRALRWLLAGAAALPLASCGGGQDASSGDGAAATSGVVTTASLAAGAVAGTGCAAMPEESAGAHPADGTNRNADGIVDALALPGIVRSDIRASIGGAGAAGGLAAGIPLTIRLQLVNVGANCAAAAGAAVYLWHCDRDGNYSMYGALAGENYLRGVQEADADGFVTFTSIFPGCYAGRMPHVHVEVYRSLAAATNAANRIRTSQFTFPTAALDEVYAADGYAASARNLSAISYATDNVFNDGVTLQMGSVSGSVAAGYTVTLAVGVSL
jgi:protocatechuate 3,4-dioxygenase beta subunit